MMAQTKPIEVRVVYMAPDLWVMIDDLVGRGTYDTSVELVRRAIIRLHYAHHEHSICRRCPASGAWANLHDWEEPP